MSCGVLAMKDGMDEEQNPEGTEHFGPSVYRLIQKIGGSVQVTVSVKSSKSNWEQALRWFGSASFRQLPRDACRTQSPV